MSERVWDRVEHTLWLIIVALIFRIIIEAFFPSGT